MNNHITNVNEEAWVKPADFPGVALQLLVSKSHTEAASMIRVQVEKDAEITTHSHRCETELIYIIKGQPVLVMEGEEFKLTAGSVAVIPQNIAHSLYNPHSEIVEIIAFHSPPTR